MTVGEFLTPDDLSLEHAGEALERRLGAVNGRTLEGDRSFYDTFDGRLSGAGLSLSHAGGYLELTERETGEVRARLKADRPAAPWLANELSPGPLREALERVTEPRAL